MAFNYTTKVGRVQIDDSKNVPFTPTPSLQNNTYLYGNRRPLAMGEISLPTPIPANGFPRFDYYTVYKLKDELITNPGELLGYFKSCGYSVGYGYSGTTTLNNIGAYSPVPATPGKVTLYFAGQSLNVEAIANSTLSGTFTISGTAITGDIVSVETGTFNQPIIANITGDTTDTNASITNLNIDANLLMVGASISGAGIPIGATILTIDSVSSITISIAATATATGVALVYQSASPLTADTKIILNSTDYTSLQIGLNLTLNFVQQSSNPDINTTEPFIMNLWQAATAMANLNGDNQNATVGAPAVYFSILPDYASTNYFQATGTAMPLGGAPTVSAVADNIVTLTIPLSLDYTSFIPSMTFGNSTITQATTLATGTIFEASVNGNSILVKLINVTGTFNITNALTLVLDNTITIMTLQQEFFAKKRISLRTFPCIYPINNNNDINSVYNALFAHVIALNSPLVSNDGQANCSIVFGNQTLPWQTAETTLPNAINNQYYEPVYFPLVIRPGVVVQSTAQTMCAMAMVMASNIYPFNPFNDIVINGFNNSTFDVDWIDMKVGGVADELINLGWNVISTNTQGQQYLFLGRSGQTTINNAPDNEFYPSYVLDTKDYYTKAVILICRNAGVGQVRQTSTTLNSINLGIVSLNKKMGNDGILSNVENNNNLVRVTRSTENPLGVSIYAPIQQTPGLLNVYGEVVNYSINFTLS